MFIFESHNIAIELKTFLLIKRQMKFIKATIYGVYFNFYS